MTIQEIVARKEELIDLKKAAVKYADPATGMIKPQSTTKAEPDQKTDIVKVVANTYNWLDSHGDVHVEGCFKKTVKENLNRIVHLHDHVHQITAKVGNIQSIEETQIPWSMLGVDKAGNTTALVMESKLREDFNKMVYEAYKNGEVYNHSVGMIYVKIELAVNDDEYKEEFSVWNKYFPTLGNQDKAESLGYFWVVKEAKLKEVSALLFDGSNELTPTLSNKDNESVIVTTQTPEPLNTDTLKADGKQFFINLLK